MTIINMAQPFINQVLNLDICKEARAADRQTCKIATHAILHHTSAKQEGQRRKKAWKKGWKIQHQSQVQRIQSVFNFLASYHAKSLMARKESTFEKHLILFILMLLCAKQKKTRETKHAVSFSRLPHYCALHWN